MRPHWAVRIVGRLAHLVPEGVVLRLLPRRYRVRATDIPDPVRAPDADIRLFIAPVNFAGQGAMWARAVDENIAGTRSETMAYVLGNEFSHEVGQSVPVAVYLFSKKWQRAQRAAVLAGFSHVLVEAGRNPFGRIFDQGLDEQVADLTRAGIRVGFLAHGTDVRVPSRHRAENEDSPYQPGVLSGTRRLEREARRNRRTFDRLGLPVFVSTPDLLIDLPDATWLPVAVDPVRWHSDAVPLSRARPVVAHIPSRAAVKGSDLIDPVLTRLDAEGVVEYRRIEGVSSDRMPAAYGGADIVLDQFRLGSYGVAACEAMAAGRIVVGHVSQQTRDHVKTHTGMELPIVESTAGDIESTIRLLVGERERFSGVGEAGRAFVAAVHDGRRSAEVLRPFLES